MTPDLASIIDEQEAEIGRLVAELSVVRRDWQADVGTLTANLNTAEARVTALERDLDAARAEAAWLKAQVEAVWSVLGDYSKIGELTLRNCIREQLGRAALRGPAQSEQP